MKHKYTLFLVGLFLLILFSHPLSCLASVKAGVGVTDLTPPLATPSSGYTDRKSTKIQGIHDPLLAIALFLDNGEKQIVFCSVDPLGFTYKMVQEITKRIQSRLELEDCEVYIGSSHTHSGGGSYLNIPVLGEALAGPYDPKIEDFYVTQTHRAITLAFENQVLAKIGIGYGETDSSLNRYRSTFPENVAPLPTISVIKVVKKDGSPLAVLFNYPIHPTVFTSENTLFPADLVGYAKNHITELLGENIQPLYFNGAQGDILPVSFDKDPEITCDLIGTALASSVKVIWDDTPVSDTLDIEAVHNPYSFIPQATPFGLVLPIPVYDTEMSLIVLNKTHAFLTIPGELSCLYDKQLKQYGTEDLGFTQVSILGLTKDAHGYIILPESWSDKTMESSFSFGGEPYGELVAERSKALLDELDPYKKMPFKNIQSIELDWIRTIQGSRTPLFDVFFYLINFFDTTAFAILLVGTLWIVSGWRKGIQIFYLLFCSSLLNQLLKFLFSSPRPCALDPSVGLIKISGFGFPSGGAQTSILLAAMILISWKTQWWRWPLAILTVLCISFARVYLGIHFLSDIVGGWIVGASLVWVYLTLFPLWSKKLSSLQPFTIFIISQLVPLSIYFLTPLSYMCGGAMGLGAGLYINHLRKYTLPLFYGKKETILRIVFLFVGILCLHDLFFSDMLSSFSTSKLGLFCQFFLIGLWVGTGFILVWRQARPLLSVFIGKKHE